MKLGSITLWPHLHTGVLEARARHTQAVRAVRVEVAAAVPPGESVQVTSDARVPQQLLEERPRLVAARPLEHLEHVRLALCAMADHPTSRSPPHAFNGGRSTLWVLILYSRVLCELCFVRGPLAFSQSPPLTCAALLYH